MGYHITISKLWIVMLGVALACVASLAIYYFGNPQNHYLPPDQDLIATFREQRPAFERLRQMSTEDIGTESYFSKSDLDPKLSEPRRQEYRELLAEIHHGLVVTDDYDGTVRFIFAGGGLSAISPGWLKGVEYVSGSIEKKGSTLKSLDGADRLPAGVYLRPIEPHWFVVYQRTDD